MTVRSVVVNTRRTSATSEFKGTCNSFAASRSAVPIVSVWRVFWNVAVGDQIHLELSCISDSKPAEGCSHDMTRAAPLSPIIRLLALVLADVISGITEASITRNL